MAITQAVCTSFKQELLTGTHNFTATSGDTFKIALYTSSASLDASTTAFSTSNQVLLQQHLEQLLFVIFQIYLLLLQQLQQEEL